MKRLSPALGALVLFGPAPAAFADDLPVRLAAATAPVHPGGTVVLAIETAPGAICEGSRQGHYGDAFTITLPRQEAGADGKVRWQWSVVAGNRPIGRRGVHVSCTSGSRKGKLETAFIVE